MKKSSKILIGLAILFSVFTFVATYYGYHPKESEIFVPITFLKIKWSFLLSLLGILFDITIFFWCLDELSTNYRTDSDELDSTVFFLAWLGFSFWNAFVVGAFVARLFSGGPVAIIVATGVHFILRIIFFYASPLFISNKSSD